MRRKIGARRRASSAKDARWANATIPARLAKKATTVGFEPPTAGLWLRTRDRLETTRLLSSYKHACIWCSTLYILILSLNYLRTIHYSSRSFFILLLISLLALPFCSYVSLPCCNHATRNTFYSYRLIYLRTIHSVVYIFAANYSKRIRRNL